MSARENLIEMKAAIDRLNTAFRYKAQRRLAVNGPITCTAQREREIRAAIEAQARASGEPVIYVNPKTYAEIMRSVVDAEDLEEKWLK